MYNYHIEPFRDMDRAVFVHGGGGLGCLWFIGWLFTIGYLRLSFWKGVLAIVIWPYYLGKHYAQKHNTQHNN